MANWLSLDNSIYCRLTYLRTREDSREWEFRMEFTFVVESMIRGYHEYTVWENPVLAEELRCTKEIGNPRDPAAVAIQNELVAKWISLGTSQKEFPH